MTQITAIGQQHLLLFILVLTRLSFILMAMPAVGAGVPRRVKALFALGLTLMLLPLVGGITIPEIRNLADLGIAMSREAMVGALIGLVVQLLTTGVQLAGELISSTGGTQLGAGVDPLTEAPMPVLSTLIGLLVTAVFIAAGGHHLMIDALIKSFETIPPGDVRIEAGWIKLITYELTQGMAVGVRGGAPVVAALLLANLITGLLSRTLPQLNILAVGLNINAIALLSVSAVTLGTVGLIFENELDSVFARLGELLAASGG